MLDMPGIGPALARVASRRGNEHRCRFFVPLAQDDLDVLLASKPLEPAAGEGPLLRGWIEEADERVERWPRWVRLVLIVGGGAALWYGVVVAASSLLR